MRAFWILGVVAVLIAPARPASADVRDLALPGWYGKVGVETGIVIARSPPAEPGARDRGASPLLGGVVTLVHLNEHLEWVGVQADLLADGNSDGPAGSRWSVGPELGRSIFGVDAGYFGQRLDGATHHGFQVRAKLTVGLAAVYMRASYALTGSEETSLDIGLQLKAPVWVHRKPPPVTPVARR